MPDPLEEQRQRERAVLERIKELEHAHRNRLRRSGAVSALSFRFLRTFARRLVTPTARRDPTPVPRPAPGAMAVTFVGHATAMLTTSRARVLTDPFLRSFLWGMRRAEGAVLADDDRDDVSLVLLSHLHDDHFDPPSLRALPASAVAVVPSRCAKAALALDHFADVVELHPGETVRHHDLTIHAVPARHDGGRLGSGWSFRGANGYVVVSPDVTAYFAGDTGYFSGFADIGRRLRPDVALLPVTGYEPFPLRATHMSPLDAVAAFEDLRARVLVPVGHGAFPIGYEDPNEPLAWLRELAVERKLGEALALLPPGGTLTLHRRAT